MSTDQQVVSDAGVQVDAANEADKPMDAAESAKVRAALAAANKQAKEHRERAAGLEKEKADADRAKAEAEGNLAKLRELDAAERKALAAERDTLAVEAKKAERYESALRAHVESVSAKLSEADKALVAGLPIDQQLAFASRLAGVQPAAAGARTVGSPAPTQMPVDLSKMTESQATKHFLENPKALADFQQATFKRRNTF